MKILSITTDPNAGGSSMSLLNLLKGLKKKGHEVHVIVPKDGYLSQQLKLEGIDCTIIPTIRAEVWPRKDNVREIIYYLPRIVSRTMLYYVSKHKIKTIINQYQPDLIHSNVSLTSIGYRLAKENKIPHVWHIREYGDLDFGLKFFPTKSKQLEYLKDSYTIAIAEGIKEHYNLTSNCRVIYNGIRSSSFSCPITDKDNYILFVGHVNPNKGVSELISAYIRYKEKGGRKRLKIAGTVSNEYRIELENMLKSYNLNDDVDFLGQRNDIDSLMQKASVLVVTSKFEAFGRITAEAMFNNCLVIGKNTGGTKEQIELGKQMRGRAIGYIYNTEQELADLMLSIDSLNAQEQCEMIYQANHFVKEFFSTEKNILETESFFKEIAKINQ